MRRLLSIAATFALCAVMVAGCGGDDSSSTPTIAPRPTVPSSATATARPTLAEPTAEIADGTPTPAATPTPEPSATPEPTSTPSPSATPTPTLCTAAGVGTPVRASSVEVDFDGAGGLDVLSVYGVGDASAPEEWRIRVDTAAGESFDDELHGVDPGGFSPVSALGAHDIDGDGSPELFAMVGAGASASIVGLTTRMDCDLVPVTLGGAAAAFPVGGSVGQIAGLECAGGRLIAWSGSADFDANDGSYEIDGVELELDGAVVTEGGTQSFSANISEADFVYGNLTCGDVNF